MIRRMLLALCLCAAALCLAAPAAQAAFGLSEFDVSFAGPEGEAVTQAGSHPFAMTTKLKFLAEGGGGTVEQAAKDIFVSQPAGLVGNPTAVPTCTTAEFLSKRDGCPDASALGTISVELGASNGGGNFAAAVYNLQPPPGKAAKLGFWVLSVPVTVELGVEPTAPFKITGGPTGISQAVEVVAATLTLWGVPASEAHDAQRGTCFFENAGLCKANISETPFLTLPRSCTGALKTEYAADSWEHPGAREPDGLPRLTDPNWVTGFALTHDSGGNPRGLSGCGNLGFGPEIGIAPTSAQAESASGLDVSIDVTDEGVHNPVGNAAADIEAMEFFLPKGVTANPSAAEGLGVCSEAQIQAAGLTVQGCPEASKLGSLEVETPILEHHTLKGTFYLAEQERNPFGSLLAAYLVIRDEELGVFVELPAEIEIDEATGQLVTTVEELPPFPLEHVRVRLRSGPRAPLITPPTCGTYASKAILYPSSGGEPLERSSSFEVTSGPGGGPCPAAGRPPFAPGFEAGTANSAASRYSPFAMRLTRRDGEQDITRFSATLPPGVVGKLAGVGLCPDAAIAAAAAPGRKGREELASPSCPAASKVGTVLAGAGVGTALTYVPGSLYLAGPYKGAPRSVAAIVPAVAGPFDVGVVITRVGLKLNPATAQVEVDGAASDPIPHILKGIPLKLRDLRVYADRPEFTLNPTGCHTNKTLAQIFGSGTDVFSPADDVPAAASSRFQASSCASLGFKPKLSLQLKGPTRRSGHPAVHSTVTYPYPAGPGYANIAKAVVTLPPTEFIDNAHINNPCTRVQFNANNCPPKSVLGTAKAISPLLDEPLEGPVYFRSNGGERNLPDVVADLHGVFEVVLVGFVDTATPKTNPRLRTTFAGVPDAPVSSFELNLFGGNRGLLVNNTNLCAKKRTATVEMIGQNGRRYETQPTVKTSCKKKK
jgi:hypothetical protein